MESVKLNFPIGSKLGFVSTIQFVPTLQEAKLQLEQNGFEIALSQNQPLSPGEVLGCTAPVIENVDGIIYLGKIMNFFHHRNQGSKDQSRLGPDQDQQN